MVSQRLTQRFALEFCLPISLLGIFFWLGGRILQDNMLGQVRYIDGTSSDEFGSSREMLGDAMVIRAEIDVSQGRTQVEVTPLNSLEPPLELEFQTIQINQLTVQIAETLGITPQQVTDQIRYRVNPAGISLKEVNKVVN